MNLISQDYLIHHGVKGMKWGVRRYQNPDGSLTSTGQRRLYKKVRRAKTDPDKKLLIKKSVNNIDIQNRQKALKNVHDHARKTADYDSKMDVEVDRLADKLTKPIYEREIKKIGNVSERDKSKIYEQIKYDDAWWKAEAQIKKQNPQYNANAKKADALWNEYTKQNKKIVDSIVGSYGDKKVTETYKFQNRNEYKYLVEDVLNDIYYKKQNSRW